MFRFQRVIENVVYPRLKLYIVQYPLVLNVHHLLAGQQLFTVKDTDHTTRNKTMSNKLPVGQRTRMSALRSISSHLLCLMSQEIRRKRNVNHYKYYINKQLRVVTSFSSYRDCLPSRSMIHMVLTTFLINQKVTNV